MTHEKPTTVALVIAGCRLRTEVPAPREPPKEWTGPALRWRGHHQVSRRPKSSRPDHRRKRSAASPELLMVAAYQSRNAILRNLGWATHQDYLKSELWATIKARVLRAAFNLCAFCKRRAFQVHHVKYTRGTLLGRNDANLLAICGRCHRRGEFDGKGRKLSPDSATKRMAALALTPHPKPEAPTDRFWKEARKLSAEFHRALDGE